MYNPKLHPNKATWKPNSVWFILACSAITITVVFLSFNANIFQNLRYPGMDPPQNLYKLLGKSPSPLGSILVNSTTNSTLYGGNGDKPHLGGWTAYDHKGVSNMTWDYMIGILGVKSVLDIGCGRGISTSYFLSKGVKVLCVEGSHDAVLHSFLPQALIVEHDYTRGPWWPDDSYDACWSVEFLEHVSRQYFKNYINTFRKCALIFATSSVWGGYHHVEVHPDYWWKGRFQAVGIQYFDQLTQIIQSLIKSEKPKIKQGVINMTEEMNNFYDEIGEHIHFTMRVYINPTIASLPKHDHLFSGDGCYKNELNNRDGGTPCLGEDKLPDKYNSLIRCYRDKKASIAKGIPMEEMYWNCG